MLPATAFTISYGMPNLQAKLIRENLNTAQYHLQNFGLVVMRIDMRIFEKATLGISYGYASYYITNGNDLSQNRVNKTYVNSVGVRLNKYFIIKKYFAFYLGDGGGFCINQYQNTDGFYCDAYHPLKLTHLYFDLITRLKYKPTKFFNVFIEGGINRFSIANAGISVAVKK